MTLPPPPTYTADTPSSSTWCPPVYSPSSLVPSYAAEPLQDEVRLDFVGRSASARPTPDGTFVKAHKGITVVLAEQENGIAAPTYPRHATIRGDVILEEIPSNLQMVSVKLEGRQSLTIAEGGTADSLIFTETHVLWKRGGTTSAGPSSSSSATCPSILPIRIPLPQTFQDDSIARPLPPSFTAEFPGVPGLCAKCTYSLTVILTKSRLAKLKSKTTLSVPIRYSPRTRPYLPIAPELHPFFSTVKSTPGDWHQVTSTMHTRPGLPLRPIECHLFIPAVQIYAIADTIPFHLQLRSQSKTLRSFLFAAPPSPTRKPKRKDTMTSMTSSLSNTAFSFTISHTGRTPPPDSSPDPLPWYDDDKSSKKPSVRVFLLRQICARVHGQRAWRNIVLGEGKLWPTQPPESLLDPTVDADLSLDWEGEVRCNADVNVGGFSAGALVVKDFIVLELKPPVPETSPLIEMQHAHPIRLVTDTFVDS